MLNKLALGLLLGACASTAMAQASANIEAKQPASAYSQDGRGAVVRSPYGLCWRTGYWTPANSIAGCDGELAPPVLKATAPAFVAPALEAAPPPAPTATQNCAFNITLAHEQTFDFGQTTLTDDAKIRIDTEVISKLTGCNKNDVIMVTGHTDRIGSLQSNKNLSEERAAVIAGYLKSKGVSTPIEAIGVGETQPVKVCTGNVSKKELIACLAPNRRVIIEKKQLFR